MKKYPESEFAANAPAVKLAKVLAEFMVTYRRAMEEAVPKLRVEGGA